MVAIIVVVVVAAAAVIVAEVDVVGASKLSAHFFLK